jgi:hypothetical protein
MIPCLGNVRKNINHAIAYIQLGMLWKTRIAGLATVYDPCSYLDGDWLLGN